MVGYKVLIINYRSSALLYISSPLFPHNWTRGWNKSEGIGFYSFSDPCIALYYRNTGIAVQVELAGNVKIHEHGFISEYCKITGVCRDNGIANTLGVPLVPEPKTPEVSYTGNLGLNGQQAYIAYLKEYIGRPDGAVICAKVKINNYTVQRYYSIKSPVPESVDDFIETILPRQSVSETLKAIMA